MSLEKKSNVSNKMRCPFCGTTKLFTECRFPDSSSNIIEIFSCAQCAAFVPDYSKSEITIHNQIGLHEQIWCEQSNNEMMEAKRGMVQMLDKQQWLLGDVADHRLILDVGAGRGNLTAAFLEKGFNFLSCEPSKKLIEKSLHVYGIPDEKIINTDAANFLKIVNQSHLEGITEVSIYFWHVLEHIQNSVSIIELAAELFKGKRVNMLIQMPMLKSCYIFPEHHFLVTPDWFSFVSEITGLNLVRFSWAKNSFFMTGLYSNNPNIPPAQLKRPYRSLTQFERLNYTLSHVS